MNNNYRISRIENVSEEKYLDLLQYSDLVIEASGAKRNVVQKYKAECRNLYSLSMEVSRAELLNSLSKHFTDNGLPREQISIAVDISLLSRKLIANLFATIFHLASKTNVELFVFYGLAEYSPPDASDLVSNNYVRPIDPLFSGWAKPGLPVLTIVGLGYEENKALGAVEYLESAESVVFIPESIEKQYESDVLSKNEILLKRVPESNKIRYPVDDPAKLIFKLDSLISGYKAANKVVLFPFGPRIFFACSLIATIASPEASVWGVSGEDETIRPRDDRACKQYVCFSCFIAAKN